MSHFVQGILAGVIVSPITFTLFVIIPEVRSERRKARYEAQRRHPSNQR